MQQGEKLVEEGEALAADDLHAREQLGLVRARRLAIQRTRVRPAAGADPAKAMGSDLGSAMRRPAVRTPRQAQVLAG